MYLNIKSTHQLERLFLRQCSSPHITCQPDMSAKYHFYVDYCDAITEIKKHYNRSFFGTELKAFISSLPKPEFDLEEIKENEGILGYEAKLIKPYSVDYTKIQQFLNNCVQPTFDELSILPKKVRIFHKDNVPVSFQRLIEDKFAQVTISYFEYLETYAIDKFFAAHSWNQELLSQLLDLIENPIFEINVDNEDFTFIKITNFKPKIKVNNE